MSVHSRGDGWTVRWEDASGIQRSKQFRKGERKKAEAHDDEIKRAKRLGYLSHLQASSRTVADVMTEWTQDRLVRKAPKTRSLYRWLWDSQIHPHLADVRLSELNPKVIESWLGRLGVGVPTQRKALALLHQVLDYACKGGDLQANPCALADRPKLPEPEPVDCPSPLEIEGIRARLLEREEARDPHRDSMLVSLLAYAGLAPAEALAATWADWKDGHLVLRRPKTGRVKRTRVLSPLAEDLNAWRVASQRLHGPILGGWSESGYQNWRRRVWHGDLGLTIRPYDLRHAFVSLCLRDPDISRVEAARWAGHSLKVQDEVYAHVLGGQGSAEAAIREARARVFGAADEADAVGGGE